MCHKERGDAPDDASPRLSLDRMDCCLAEVGAEEAVTAAGAEFADGFLADLADALTGEAEGLADFLEGHLGLVVDAEAANIISAAVTKDVTHIDLTSATKVAADAAFTTANPNTLILAPAETQNTGKNVVAGDVCANLVLSDASAFAAPKAFTASQVSFSTNVNKYKTLTLPFNADVPEGFSASNATSVTGTTVNLESTSTINANSPVLIEGEGTLELKATNAVVNATGDAALTNGMLSGTFKSIPAPVGSYVLQKHSGLTGFYLVADVQPTVGAFRAHLNVTESGVKLYTFGDEATGISLTPALSEKGTTYYYNVSGQRMSKMQRGINIVNGKKIIY